MKKRLVVPLLALLLLAGTSWAGTPDLEGRITGIDHAKGVLRIRNVIQSRMFRREYRIYADPGMLNGFRMHDRVRVWLVPHRKEAATIEYAR